MIVNVNSHLYLFLFREQQVFWILLPDLVSTHTAPFDSKDILLTALLFLLVKLQSHRVNYIIRLTRCFKQRNIVLLGLLLLLSFALLLILCLLFIQNYRFCRIIQID